MQYKNTILNGIDSLLSYNQNIKPMEILSKNLQKYADSKYYIECC